MHAQTFTNMHTNRHAQQSTQKSNCRFLRLVFHHFNHIFSHEPQLCKRESPSVSPMIGPSIGWSVHWSVGPLVGPSVGNLFFSGQKSRRRMTYAVYPALLLSTAEMDKQMHSHVHGLTNGYTRYIRIFRCGYRISI